MPEDGVSDRSIGDVLRAYFRIAHGLLLALILQGLLSCSTTSGVQPVPLETVLSSPAVASLDYELSEGGLIIFSLDIHETGVGKFILDTGATTSVIFRPAILPDTLIEDGGDVRIHDMNEFADRPTAAMRNFFIGSKEIESPHFAILDQPQYSDPLLAQTKGVRKHASVQ